MRVWGWEMVAGGSEIPGQSPLHREFEANLKLYLRVHHKQIDKQIDARQRTECILESPGEAGACGLSLSLPSYDLIRVHCRLTLCSSC